MRGLRGDSRYESLTKSEVGMSKVVGIGMLASVCTGALLMVGCGGSSGTSAKTEAPAVTNQPDAPEPAEVAPVVPDLTTRCETVVSHVKEVVLGQGGKWNAESQTTASDRCMSEWTDEVRECVLAATTVQELGKCLAPSDD